MWLLGRYDMWLLGGYDKHKIKCTGLNDRAIISSTEGSCAI